MAKGLTDQQRNFALRYVANGQNATEAATFAGYSPKDAAARGSKLRKDPRVSVFIAEQTVKALAGGAVEAAKVEAEAAKATSEAAKAAANAAAKAAEASAKVQERMELTAARVLGETMKLAFSDARKVWNDDGSMLPPKDWPDEMAGAVSGIEIEELFEGKGKDRMQVGFTKKLKLWDKPKALEMLGKHLKLWTEVVEAKIDGLDDAERAARAARLIAEALGRKRAV